MKLCNKCGEISEGEFYVSCPTECKSCIRARVSENRLVKIEHYREYDRNRGCRQTPEYLRDRRKKFPNQTKAQRKVAYEISKGSLVPEPCESCGDGDRPHAHHDDYLKPLNIRWLCAAHHKQWHRDNGEALNP